MAKCCDMHSGKLRTRIEFQRKTRLPDGAGGFSETWSKISGAPEYAYARAVSGSERYASDRVEARTKVRVTVRYFDGLRDDDRVVINGDAHNITFINNVDFRGRWLEIDLAGGAAT